MGKRIDLSQLASEPVLDAPLPPLPEASKHLTQVPVHVVAANPINPRELVTDLSDLESMRSVGQLQPCAVVTRGAFLAIYPEHADRLGDADYVVVAGSRRRLAAERFGLATLDIVVRDRLASDRATFYAAAVTENIDRQNLDALEEARAVERLAQECGSGTKAGEILGKSKGWVSQRLALLKLSVEMRQLLRAGDLPIRDARRLAALPEVEQIPTWRAERVFTAVNARESPSTTGASPAGSPQNGASRPAPGGSATPPRSRGLRIPAAATIEAMAVLLREHLTVDERRQLADALLAVAQDS